MGAVKPHPEPGRIAAQFARMLREWLTEEEMAEVIRRNREERGTIPLICHSHDFCGASEAMLVAFRHFNVSTDGDPDERGWGKLWGDAWALAKRNEFKVDD